MHDEPMWGEKPHFYFEYRLNVFFMLHYSILISAEFRKSNHTLMTSGALQNWCCSVESSRAHLCRKSMSIPSTRMRELRYLQPKRNMKVIKDHRELYDKQGTGVHMFSNCELSNSVHILVPIVLKNNLVLTQTVAFIMCLQKEGNLSMYPDHFTSSNQLNASSVFSLTQTLCALTQCGQPMSPCFCLLGVCWSAANQTPAPWTSLWSSAGRTASSQSKHNTGIWSPAAETVLSDTAGTTVTPASPSGKENIILTNKCQLWTHVKQVNNTLYLQLI